MYTIYPTRVEALIANVQAAAAVGCDMIGTTERYTRHNHPTDGRSALKDGIGQATKEQLEAEGWFSDANY